MTKKRMGCLAVVILLTGMVLAGCVGSEAGGQAQSDNTTDQADDVDQNLNTTDADDGNVTEDDSEVEKSYRVPSDAMDAEPAKTQEGMAKFELSGDAKPMTDTPGVCASFLRFSGDASGSFFPTIAEYEIEDPGDLTFFDMHLSADSDYQDLGMTLYNESGEEVAEADDFASTGEYLFWTPEQGDNQTYTLEIWQSCQDPTDRSYSLDVWVWTHDDWNASHPFTDVWQKSYDWGQAEVCPQEPACVSLVWSGPADPTGTTDDGQIDMGGYSWSGCATSGGGPALLPCDPDPYKKVSIVINDDVAGQQVAAIMTTCSNDGDNWCGETDNVEQENKCSQEVPLIGGISCQKPGPNELRATFCGVINGVTRDGTTDKDGTGPGVWDQSGEEYETANGSYEEHPGVGTLAVFLRGPQRGGGGICPDANPYHGPTTGTITIIAQK